jgi:hypothetical protein
MRQHSNPMSRNLLFHGTYTTFAILKKGQYFACSWRFQHIYLSPYTQMQCALLKWEYLHLYSVSDSHQQVFTDHC